MVLFIIVFSFLMPAIMILFGLWMHRYPPKEINGLIGYRTPRSMASKEAWDFAHRHFGRIWFYEGMVLAVVTGGAIYILWSTLLAPDGEAILPGIILLQLTALIIPIFFTEHALKSRFDDQGRPK